jgi:hypothetical protein
MVRRCSQIMSVIALPILICSLDCNHSHVTQSLESFGVMLFIQMVRTRCRMYHNGRSTCHNSHKQLQSSQRQLEFLTNRYSPRPITQLLGTTSTCRISRTNIRASSNITSSVLSKACHVPRQLHTQRVHLKQQYHGQAFFQQVKKHRNQVPYQA